MEEFVRAFQILDVGGGLEIRIMDHLFGPHGRFARPDPLLHELLEKLLELLQQETRLSRDCRSSQSYLSYHQPFQATQATEAEAARREREEWATLAVL